MIRWALIALVCTVHVTFCQDSVKLDLHGLWLQWDGKEFKQHQGTGRAIYLRQMDIQPGVLEVKAEYKFQIFVGNRLIAGNTKLFRKSISELFPGGTNSYVAIFSSQNANQINTILKTALVDDPHGARKSNNSNFIVIMTLLLMILLIWIIRANPVQSLEYFNVMGILRIRPTEDAPMLRLTSVTNLFYYLFCSMLVATIILAFKYGADINVMPLAYAGKQVGLGVLAVLALMAAKALLVKLFSGLFGVGDFGAVQFQDWVKLLLAGFAFCAVLLVVLIMLNQPWYSWILALRNFIIALQIFFLAVVSLKLIRQTGFTVSHLFSYLCVSEIIPLVILLNVYIS